MFHKTYCHQCGKIVESSGHTCEIPQPIPVGWKCPVCGHGNAPWASYCYHCIDTTGKSFPTIEDWEWGPTKKATWPKPPVDWLWRPEQITFTCAGRG